MRPLPRIIVSVAALVLLWTACALAIVPSKPYTFTPNTTIFSAQVNSDFDTLYTVLNGQLDHSNLAAGTGLYASDIKPLNTAGATFGGAVSYTFNTDLQVLGPTGLTVERNIVVGGPGFPYSGAISVSSATVGGGAASITPTSVCVGQVNPSCLNTGTSILFNLQMIGSTGITLTSPVAELTFAGPTGGGPFLFAGGLSGVGRDEYGITAGGNPYWGISGTGVGNSGCLLLEANGTSHNPTFESCGDSSAMAGNPLTYLPPAYLHNGTAPGGAIHDVADAFSAAGTSVTVTFSGSAVYTNALSYGCMAVDQATGVVIGGANVSGTQVTFSGTVNSHTYRYRCNGG